MKRAENESPVKSEAMSFTFNAFFQNLKSIWWLVVTLIVSFSVAAYIIFAVTFVPLYRSTARFTIVPLVDSNASSGASVYVFNYNETLSQQMAATFPHIIDGGFLTEVVMADVGRDVDGTVTATAIEDTNIFELHVVSPKAQDAYDILMSMIKNYPKIAEHVVGDTRMNVLAGSEPLLATAPYNTGKVYTYVLVGAVLGLGIGIAFVIIRMYTRKTVFTRRDIEVSFNGKCICEIPEVHSKRTSNNQSVAIKGPSELSGFSESIRVLKQRVKFNASTKGVKVIGIISAIDGEGKTTISYNLAKSLSLGSKKVVLVDIDFKKRSMQSILNHKNEVENVGVAEIIRGSRKIEECVHSISETFDVLFAGTDRVTFLKRDYYQIFDYLREHYEYVIVDMPDCGVPESAALADFCDGLLFTIKWNSTDRPRISNALRYLASSDTAILGYILNCVDINRSDYGGYKYHGKHGTHRYGYGYHKGAGSRYGYGRRYGYGYGYGYGCGYGSYNNNGYGNGAELISQESVDASPLK